MKSSSSSSIATNTIMLYLRMLIALIISLYTSKIILKALGVEDYGIFNVVGGVVILLSFLNSSLTAATQRFITFEIGKGNNSTIRNTFVTCVNTHITISLIIP